MAKAGEEGHIAGFDERMRFDMFPSQNARGFRAPRRTIPGLTPFGRLDQLESRLVSEACDCHRCRDMKRDIEISVTSDQCSHQLVIRRPVV